VAVFRNIISRLFIAGKHVMDASCASATGMYDPFTMQWIDWFLKILNLPRSIFPEVVDTAGNFGVTPKDVFGVEVPICCSVSVAPILTSS